MLKTLLIILGWLIFLLLARQTKSQKLKFYFSLNIFLGPLLAIVLSDFHFQHLVRCFFILGMEEHMQYTEGHAKCEQEQECILNLLYVSFHISRNFNA
jgi:uncharacterized membrane protein YhdT